MRRAELARLKIRDIDSQRMVIHIQGGKGREDRDVMLSPKLLEALREYWRGLKHKPSQWLFPGGCSHTANRPITPKTVWYACPNESESRVFGNLGKNTLATVTSVFGHIVAFG
jgi:integrase